MKAIEAIEKSKLAQKTISRRVDKENKLKKEAQIKSEKTASQKYFQQLLQKVREQIEWAVRNGKTQITFYIKRNINVHFYGGRAYVIKDYEHSKEIIKVKKILEKDGYRVEYSVSGNVVNDGVAYLNSGGECGSPEPYYVDNLILDIK